MPTLRIDGLRTVNQLGQNARLFDPFSDALALTMDVYASPDLLALPSVSFSAEFQIFDPHLHTVVARGFMGSPFNWGSWFWISKGRNWAAPYSTPQAWGLNWTQNSVFGFRGIIKASYIPTSPPGSGWYSTEAFDVSGYRWFRVREVFAL